MLNAAQYITQNIVFDCNDMPIGQLATTHENGLYFFSSFLLPETINELNIMVDGRMQSLPGFLLLQNDEDHPYIDGTSFFEYTFSYMLPIKKLKTHSAQHVMNLISSSPV